MNPDHEKEKYETAKKKVAQKKEFYKHLIIFGLFSILFFVLNMIFVPERIWFHYAILSWGIGGVLTHYLSVFGIPNFPLLGKKWEQKAIENEIEKMELDANNFPLPDKEEKMEVKELRKNYNENDLV